MKYLVGTKWLMTTQAGELFIGEVLDLTDERIQKVKMPGDICMWFEECKFGSTYDSDFLDSCCLPYSG